MRLLGCAAIALATLAVTLAACAPMPGGAGRAQPGQPVEVRKTITIGVAGPITAFSVAEVGSGQAGRALTEVWIQGLVTSGVKTPAPEPRIAAELPALDRGTMRVEPDGQMTVVWRLRPDVHWADETPLTAHDFLFGHQVMNDAEMPFPSGTLGRRLSSISAPDDYTLVMVWKEPFYEANAVGSNLSGLQPLPRHVLLEDLESRNFEGFKNHPYWTSGFFHVGPFRPVRFDPSVEIVLEAVPHYFLGRPKVDTIVVKQFADANTVYAALLAGGIDMTTDNTLRMESAFELKEQWERTGEGKVYIGMGTSRAIFPQFASEYQDEPAFFDRRVRQALFFAVDRVAWTDSVMGTKTDLVANGLLPPNHHLAGYTKDSLATYRYDPQRAVAMLAEAGWSRGADGFLTHVVDQRRFKSVVWSTQGAENETAILADMWKQVGLDTSIYILPNARREDREFWQSYPNVEISARGYGDTMLTRFECVESSVRPTQFRGANRGHYCDAANMEPLIKQYRSSLTLQEQGRYIRQVAEFAALDLPVMQLYFNPTRPAVVRGVTALADDFEGGIEAGGLYGSYFRNAHLWDRVG